MPSRRDSIKMGSSDSASCSVLASITEATSARDTSRRARSPSFRNGTRSAWLTGAQTNIVSNSV